MDLPEKPRGNIQSQVRIGGNVGQRYNKFLKKKVSNKRDKVNFSSSLSLSTSIGFDESTFVKFSFIQGTKFPDEFRWIFEFEYVDKEIEDPKLKYQYSVTPNAHAYKKDRDDLNK